MNLFILHLKFALPPLLSVCVVVAVGCSTPKSDYRNACSELVSKPIQLKHTYLAGLIIFLVAHQEASESSLIWTPSTNAVIEALDRLPNYLLFADKQPLAHPMYAKNCWPAKENLPKTICQAVSVTVKGCKGVLLNFLPADRANDLWADWREQFVKMHDAGPQWWSVVYLEEEKTFTALRFDLGF